MRDLIILAMISILIGCGSEGGSNDAKDTNEDNSEISSEVNSPEIHSIAVASVKDLPDCDDFIQSQLAYVKSTKVFYVCESSGWEEVDIKGEDGIAGKDGSDGEDAPAPLNSNEWQDAVNSKVWLLAAVGTYSAAQAACTGDYRLPTRDEANTARLHGLNTYASNFGTNDTFWTSQVWSDSTIAIFSPSGETTALQSASKSIFCIRN